MERRAAIQSLGLLASHALFPSVLAGFLTKCTSPSPNDSSFFFFTLEEMETVKVVIDTILPATNSASASQAQVHLFLDEVFARCMTSEQQSLIREGLAGLKKELMDAEAKLELLVAVDREAHKGNPEAAYFKAIKQYTLIGFFTSKEGSTKSSNYVKFPGTYQGEIPLDESTLNYANTSMRYYL